MCHPLDTRRKRLETTRSLGRNLPVICWWWERQTFGTPGTLLLAQRDPKGLRDGTPDEGCCGVIYPRHPTALPALGASSQPGSRSSGGKFGSPIPEERRAPQGAAAFRNRPSKFSPNLQGARNLWAFSPLGFCQPTRVGCSCGRWQLGSLWS